MGEQWSPQTAPAMQAEMEMIISSGLVFWNTPTTMGIRIPKVPQEVPVAKASRQPTRKIMAGRKFSRPLAWLYTRSATYTSAPRLSVMAFKVQAKVRIRMAGTMALKPSGIQAMQSWKSRTRRTWYRMAFAMTAFGAEGETAEYVPALFSTFWALVPPVVAIGLALITKEVYSSLFIGIAVGGILYSGGSFERTVVHIFQDGIIGVLTDESNVGILVFLVILGAMVSLMNKAGGSAAFGRFAAKGIKTRVGAQLATILLGVTIFIDDYFNCLTVGSVMRPVTDKFKVSRAKLAYLIDATAAPVCIIAPISSWAAAVTGFVEGEDGFSIFIQAIPYNFYALLTIVMMVGMVLMKVEFGPMLKHERNAVKGDLFTTEGRPYADESDPSVISRGTVMDLLIPIISLIICCVIGMLYTGGFFSGVDFVTAFSESNASLGLTLGSFFGLLITLVRNMDARASTARLFVFVLCISHTSSLENQKHHKRQSLTENAFVV